MSSNATKQSNGFSYIAFPAAIAAVPPLATDLYLAAMPIMVPAVWPLLLRMLRTPPSIGIYPEPADAV